MSLPSLPQIRTIVGAIGTSITEIRQFLSAIKNIKLINGVAVQYTVKITETGLTKRVVTGLGYPPTGYFITSGHTTINIVQVAAPTSETDKTVLYLNSSSSGTFTLWVF